MKIERLIGIVLYLLNREKTTANELANYFCVSRRTIIRDIDTLSLTDIPIYSEIGSKGGYSINKDYSINNRIMNHTDTDYILLALSSLKDILGEKELSRTYEKVKHIYSTERVSHSLMAIDFSVVSENERNLGIVSRIKTAIENNTVISFQYSNSKNKNRLVTANIIYVYFKWYSWYALGYDTEKKDFLVFKIKRISDLLLLDETFVNNYDIKQILEEKEFEQKKLNSTIILKYQKSLNVTIEEYFKGDIINETENYYIRESQIKINDFMTFSILLGLSDKIEILSPVKLKNRIKEHFLSALKLL
ncbi:helix-turn-helix transcriptional regulator [Enterococcus sp. AZ101]|uniref:helix-turn-helix transcriptional regulator n=1 Tax=Enterococcus sp. AZ101 TaxID=2774742 RepID=UPI003D2DCCD4